MKNTMSGRNIAKFHKMLAQEVPLKKISKFMGVSMSTLEKFTPEKTDAANKAKRLAAGKSLAPKAEDPVAEAPAKVEAPAKAAKESKPAAEKEAAKV